MYWSVCNRETYSEVRCIAYFRLFESAIRLPRVVAVASQAMNAMATSFEVAAIRSFSARFISIILSVFDECHLAADAVDDDSEVVEQTTCRSFDKLM